MKPISINIISFLEVISKVRQIVFNSVVGLLCFTFTVGCVGNDRTTVSQHPNQTSQDVQVALDSLVLKQEKGLMYYHDQPFTGIAIQHYTSQQIAQEIGYRDGLKHGEAKKWFTSGILSYQASYDQGLLTGTVRSWWSNGKLRTEGSLRNGVAHGIQRQWYQSGAKFKEITLVDGKEEGMQKAWRENGKLYNNYEAKNGRIFGLKRANLCYELEDELVQYQ